MSSDHIVLHVDRLFTGESRECVRDAVIVTKGSRIESIGPRGSVDLPDDEANVRTIHVDGSKTVVPGLIDVHSHMIMPGDGTSYERLFQQDDAYLALQAAGNARIALQAGITSLVDTGSRGNVLFSLRDASAVGLASTPRLILSGPPITRTGGHCWFLGGEADGVDGVRRIVRQLNKDGVDIVKIMATGGGTTRSYPYQPSFTQEEISAAVDEAHVMGKKSLAHCSAAAGIQRAINAGIDIVFHCHFYLPNGELCYDEGIAEQLVAKGIYVNPTLWVNRVHVERMQERADAGTLTTQERLELDHRKARYEGQATNVRRLLDAGVQLIAGSDAGWGLTGFDDVVSELECMVDIGMSPVDALLSTTLQAARAFGIDDAVGSLAAGKLADFIIVTGDPTQDTSALRNIEEVVLDGSLTVAA